MLHQLNFVYRPLLSGGKLHGTNHGSGIELENPAMDTTSP